MTLRDFTMFPDFVHDMFILLDDTGLNFVFGAVCCIAYDVLLLNVQNGGVRRGVLFL